MKKAFTVYIDDDCKPETLVAFFTQKKESGEHATHKIEKSFDSCDEEIAITFDSE